MSTPHVIGGSDAISWAIAASFRSVVHNVGESIPSESESVVIVVGVDPVVEPAHLNAVSGNDWHRMAEKPMREVLSALQRAYSSMPEEGGRIVLVLPSIGMTGAPYLVPCATAFEGIRATAKSAARQWASANVIGNLISAPLHLFAPALRPSAAHVTTAAVQDDDKIIASIAQTTRFLLKPEVTGVVGETVVVDGGAMMLP